MSAGGCSAKKYPEKRFSERKNKIEETSIRRWQETLLLLSTDDDHNVRLTIAKEAAFPKHNDKKEDIKNIWNKYITRSIGDILNSKKEFKVTCIIVRYGKVLQPLTYTLPGNSIITKYWEHIKYAEGIRFTIIDTNDMSSTSWIIVRP